MIKNVSRNKERLNWILRTVLIVMIILVVTTPIAGTCFTFLSEDDFSYESGGCEGAAQMQSSFLGSIYKVKVIYASEQGCFTPMFIDHFVRPYSRAGLPGYHMVLLTYIVLYVLALALLSHTIIKEKTVSLAVLLVAVMSSFSMSQTSIGTEIFYWYTGTVGYSVMLTLIFFVLLFYILAVRSEGAKGITFLALTTLLSFVASGAPLVLTSVNCSFILAVIILEFDKVKKRKYLVVPFITAMTGALINAMAPGNFQRSGQYVTPGHETVLDGIRDSFICLFKAYPQAFDVVFVLSAIAIFSLCILCNVKLFDGEISHVKMAVIVGGIFLVQYFEVFPGAYGNHYDEHSGHLLLVHLIVTRLSSLFVVVAASQWAREHFVAKIKVNNVFTVLKGVCIAAIALILVLPVSRNVLKESFTARTFRDFRSGAMVRVYRVREYQLSTFEMAEDGTDCIIYTPWDVSSESLPSLGIGSDSEWIVNRSAANLFGLHTTTVLHP